MRRVTIFILSLVAAIIPFGAAAQMDIDVPTARESFSQRSFRDSIKVQSVNHRYFSPALYRHQRELIRQERNQIDVTASLQGSMTNLSESWIETSGGDNTITLLASLYIKHTFTKNDFSVESYFSGKFGYYRMVLESTDDDGETVNDPVWYKNQDEIQLSVTPSLKFAENWSYGANVKFRSQFAKGFLSNASQEEYNMKSAFMAPGYLDISGGLIYKSPNSKIPVTLTLSPLALSATYVTNQTVRDNSQYKYLEHTDGNSSYSEPYGVNYLKNSNYDGGSSAQLNFERSFGKSSFLKYTTSIYTFFGWMTQLSYDNIYSNTDEYEEALEVWNASDKDDDDGIKPLLSLHPTARWENTVEIKASRLLSTTLNFQLYYNRAQNYKIQTKTLLSVGLSYSFASK
ncbi:MAG: DUF3078 domain-containing protein [Rikenellaceae bacterium]